MKNKSNWNIKSELQCLLIFKQLQADDFPRGKQMQLCRELTKYTKLEEGNLSAKVSNYKSVAGINNPSHPSSDTIKSYYKYKNTSIEDLEDIIDKL